MNKFKKSAVICTCCIAFITKEEEEMSREPKILKEIKIAFYLLPKKKPVGTRETKYRST